jgi:conjugal transfer pilus assembly protein TraK
MSQRLKKSLSLLLLSGGLSIAHATQFIDGADRQHVEVSISASEQNRLSIEGRRIASLVPSRKGILAIAKDESLGAIYFAFADESTKHGTVTLFVTDDGGVTYKMILIPRAIAGEDIILRPPSNTSSAGIAATPKTVVKAANYQRRIKNLLLQAATATPVTEPGLVIIEKEVTLWSEALLILESKLSDQDLIAEKYRLTNVSASQMLIAEQELYRPGVRSVSIEAHTLDPKQSTLVFVIRDRRDGE